jgi:hypothetical protein
MPLTQVHNSLLGQPVNHNILINPSFTVKQRGDVIAHNETTYGPDRWRVRGLIHAGGGKVHSSTAIDPTTGTNKLVVEHDGATSNTFIFQEIEAVNLQGLYGKEMTFSFSYSDVGGSGIPMAQIRSWDTSGVFKNLFNAVPTSLGDNRWTCTFTLSTEDGSIPDLIESGLRVYVYADEKNAAPSEWSVWETKLEAGSVATPFIARSYGEELALCQRYYQTYSYNEGGGNAVKYAEGVIGGRFNAAITFPSVMRAVPTFKTLAPPNLTRCTEGSHQIYTSSIHLRVDCTGSGDYRMSAGTSGAFSLDAEL